MATVPGQYPEKETPFVNSRIDFKYFYDTKFEQKVSWECLKL